MWGRWQGSATEVLPSSLSLLTWSSVESTFLLNVECIYVDLRRPVDFVPSTFDCCRGREK